MVTRARVEEEAHGLAIVPVACGSVGLRDQLAGL